MTEVGSNGSGGFLDSTRGVRILGDSVVVAGSGITGMYGVECNEELLTFHGKDAFMCNLEEVRQG